MGGLKRLGNSSERLAIAVRKKARKKPTALKKQFGREEGYASSKGTAYEGWGGERGGKLSLSLKALWSHTRWGQGEIS